MSDRELLELAAKAAGYEPSRVTDDGVVLLRGIVVRWNPLTDDGDAFRLAVALGFDVDISPTPNITCVIPQQDIEIASAEVEHNGDPFAATRRAIVCAAAAIGRTKP